MSTLTRISTDDPADCLADVVFVHGLDGDGRSTWHPKGEPDKFWPLWLAEDLPRTAVWSVDYEASSIAWKGATMPLVDRATNLLDLLSLDGIGERPVVFVCHSLGGLVVKQMMRSGADFGNALYARMAANTKAIVFISTPHSGANIANWISHLGALLRTTVTLDELKAHDPALRNLNTWYRNRNAEPAVRTTVYCEKQALAGILVVDETSADPGIPGVVPVPLDEDHASICKPASRSAQLYKGVKQAIKVALANP